MTYPITLSMIGGINSLLRRNKTSICELTESQMRKTPTRQEQAVNCSPKYSSAKLIVRKG